MKVYFRFYRTASYTIPGKVVKLFQTINGDKFPSITHVALIYEIQPDMMFKANIGLGHYSVSPNFPESEWYEDWEITNCDTSDYPYRIVNWMLNKGDMRVCNSLSVNCVKFTTAIVWGNKAKFTTVSQLYEHILRYYGRKGGG
jgi:hypothetical protein